MQVARAAKLETTMAEYMTTTAGQTGLNVPTAEQMSMPVDQTGLKTHMVEQKSTTAVWT